jgi:hypothetical protein
MPSQHTLLQADLWGQPGDAAWSFSPDAQDSGHVRFTFNGVLEGAGKTQGLLLYSQGSRSKRSHMDGTFYRDGTKLSRTQINEIQHSKKWKSRFDAFLQKVLKLGPSVNFSLSKWIDDCKNLADDTGCPAFTNTTMKAVENQLEKVEHAEDSNDIDMYIEIPAGKASSHGLSKWQSKHPELALEGSRVARPLRQRKVRSRVRGHPHPWRYGRSQCPKVLDLQIEQSEIEG